MSKVKSLEELRKMKESLQAKFNLQESGGIQSNQVQIKVAMATCGIASGAKTVMEFMYNELEKRGIDTVITQTGCMGYCYAEPTIEVRLPGQDAIVFGYVDTKKADEIIEKYIKNGELIDGIIPVNYETIDNK
jgi:NADP-reducing hydrogenase subunit HndB